MRDEAARENAKALIAQSVRIAFQIAMCEAG